MDDLGVIIPTKGSPKDSSVHFDIFWGAFPWRQPRDTIRVDAEINDHADCDADIMPGQTRLAAPREEAIGKDEESLDGGHFALEQDLQAGVVDDLLKLAAEVLSSRVRLEGLILSCQVIRMFRACEQHCIE